MERQVCALPQIVKIQVFGSTTMLKTIAMHNLFVNGPLRRRKGLLTQKDISFRTYLNRERKSSWDTFQKAPKHPTSPNPQHILIGGG